MSYSSDSKPSPPKTLPPLEKVMAKMDEGISAFQRNLQRAFDHVRATYPEWHPDILHFINLLKKRLDLTERYKILCVNALLTYEKDEEALDLEERFHKLVKLYYSYRQEMCRKEEIVPSPVKDPAPAASSCLSMPSLFDEPQTSTPTGISMITIKQEVMDQDEIVEASFGFGIADLAGIKKEFVGESPSVEEDGPISFTNASVEELEENVIKAAKDFEWRYSDYYSQQMTEDDGNFDYYNFGPE